MLEEQQLLFPLAMCLSNPKNNVQEDLPVYHWFFTTVYLKLGTHPDITYAVTKLAQFAANPSKEHMSKAQYICCYLNSTPNYSLVYDGSGDEGTIAFTDSDWAANPIKRRSITGYFFKLASGIFSWQFQAQKTVAVTTFPLFPLILSIGFTLLIRSCLHMFSFVNVCF